MKKLTNQDRLVIRARRRRGETIASIRADYAHVSTTAIWYHCQGVEVPEGFTPRKRNGRVDVGAAFEMRIVGAPLDEIAGRFGVTKQAVCIAFRRHGLQSEIRRMLEARP